jgi:hypothetical protein
MRSHALYLIGALAVTAIPLRLERNHCQGMNNGPAMLSQ